MQEMQQKARAFLILLACFLCVGCQQEEQVDFQEVEMTDVPEEDSDAPEESEERSSIFVYLCGQVQHPGVYELPRESRLYEALEAAGGMTETADQEYLNQAQLLEDGQQIYVPSKEETAEQDFQWQKGVGSGDATAVSEGKIDLNQATREELMTLTGIGEVKAEAIIQYRESHGAFQSIEELKEVDGIKDGIFQKVKDDIKV